MKVLKLTIKNIGKIAEETIELNKPLILFYGEIRQGKSTILNAVRWVCGGKFPDDIIRHGETEAAVTLEFEGGSISRSWYKAKDDSTKARDIQYVLKGKLQPRPAEKVRALLNPFLLDQDFLRNKTELERKQYFTELFGVDTEELDGELLASQNEAQMLRARIAGYGHIDLTPVEPVNVLNLQAELEAVNGTYQEMLRQVVRDNAKADEHNAKVNRGIEALAQMRKEEEELEKKLADLKIKIQATKDWLEKNKAQAKKELPAVPDTADLNRQIQEAGAINERFKTYQANLKRDDQRRNDVVALSGYEAKHREIKFKKQSLLKGISDKCGIKGLEFDDAGNFVYQGTTAGMISDSQIMTLSSELSALYPDGFGLDLIDRGESLGKSIFEFVERAKREEKTILATIVGERPSKVPEDVGVFVVSEGKLKS